jgi:hypothetical protein
VDTIADYAHELVPFPVDAICTKRPDLWQDARREIGWGAMTFPARGAA